MAIRYSGGLTIRLRYEDSASRYRCSVSDGQNREVIYVAPPATLTQAVDCSEAFDSAAHAAISFSGPALQWAAEGDENGEGWKITRAR